MEICLCGWHAQSVGDRSCCCWHENAAVVSENELESTKYVDSLYVSRNNTIFLWLGIEEKSARCMNGPDRGKFGDNVSDSATGEVVSLDFCSSKEADLKVRQVKSFSLVFIRRKRRT